MTVITRKFTFVDDAIESTPYGRSGWRLINMPSFDPCHSAFVVCHDAFEHHEGDLPDIEHEMMAFGSIYFIRVHGDWHMFHKGWAGAHGTMYSDIRLFLGTQNNWNINDCDHEICPELIHDYQEQVNRVRNDYATSVEYEEEFNRKLIGLERAFRWISKGYRRAQARWAGHSPKAVCKLFEDTVRKIETYSHEDKPIKHGDTLTIQFDTEKLVSTFKHTRRYKRKIKIAA